MNKIEVTFQHASWERCRNQIHTLLGAPAERKLEAQDGTTELHRPSKGDLPDVFITESQGIVKIIDQPSSK